MVIGYLHMIDGELWLRCELDGVEGLDVPAAAAGVQPGPELQPVLALRPAQRQRGGREHLRVESVVSRQVVTVSDILAKHLSSVASGLHFLPFHCQSHVLFLCDD